MAGEVVGSARVVIEPDMGGFEDALLTEVQAAADAAVDAMVAAFESGATQAADSLSQVGEGAEFEEIAAEADAAASGVGAAFDGVGDEIAGEFDGVGDQISSEVEAGAADADAALSGIGEGAGDEIANEFAGVGNQLALDLEAGAAEADAALTGIGAGAGDEVVGEFAGVGSQIAAELEAGADAGDAALSGIGSGAGDQIAAEFSGVGSVIETEVAAGASGAEGAIDSLDVATGSAVGNMISNFDGLGVAIAGAISAATVGALVTRAERINTIGNISAQLIETTGGVANVTARDLRTLGDSIEDVANIQSELVQEAGNVLLTFRNVRNEVGEGNDIFDRAIVAAADLGAVLGTDLSGSALQLGKALQDPILGMSALSRAGVTFTEQQRELVRSLVESGDTIAAQRLILEELEGQVAGAAAAAADASDDIRLAFQRVADAFALGLLPAVSEAAGATTGFTDVLEPLAGDLGILVGEILAVAVNLLEAFAPAIGTGTELLTAFLPLIDALVTVINLIPDEALAAAAAFLVFNRALSTLNRLAAARGFATIAAGLTSLGPALAIAGAVAILADELGLLIDPAEEAARVVRDLTGDVDASSLEEVRATIARLNAEIEEQRDVASPGLLAFGDQLENFAQGGGKLAKRNIEELTAELERFLEVEEGLVQARIAEEFQPIIDNVGSAADVFAAATSDAPAFAAALRDVALEGDRSQESFLNLAVAADAAQLSEEQMAAAAEVLGTSVEELRPAIERTVGAIDEFVDTALGNIPQVADAFSSFQRTVIAQLPGVESAFQDLNESGTVSAEEFARSLDDIVESSADFTADLAAITRAGFGDVAEVIGQQGPEVGAALANQLANAADDGSTAMLERISEGVQAVNTELGQITVTEFITELDSATARTEAFRSDLETITAAGFEDVAGIIAQQGPEIAAGMANELANAAEQGRTALLTGVRRSVDEANAEFTAMEQFLRNELGPRFIITSGLLGSGATAAFGAGLDFAERLNIAGFLARGQLSEEGQAIATIALAEGQRAAREYGRLLNLDNEVIEEGIRAANTFRRNPGDAIGAAIAAGQAVADGFVLGIRVVADAGRVVSQVNRLAQQARGAMTTGLQLGSPSRIFEQFGEDTVEGFVLGLEAQESDVVRAAEDIARAAAEGVQRTPAPTVPVDVQQQDGLTGPGFTAPIDSARDVAERLLADIGTAVAVGQTAQPILIRLVVDADQLSLAQLDLIRQAVQVEGQGNVQVALGTP